MPAFNMNGTAAANPSAGKQVMMSPFSGPKGSPLDARVSTGTGTNTNDPNNLSTGQLSTGIGFGLNLAASADKVGVNPIPQVFTDDYTPGVTKPDGTASANSTLVAIGGGKSDATGAPVPYTAGFGLLGWGGGGSRDAGAGPAFTGFLTKMVTAVGTVAPGAAIEATWLNREDIAITVGQSTFGSSNAASAAIA